MNHKYNYICLIICSILVTSYYIFKKKNVDNYLLMLPYDYYMDPDEILLDLNDFKYLLSSGVCNQNITHIHLVTSYAGNIEARSAIRRAYPSSELDKLGIARVFLLAVLPRDHEVTQNALINENTRFKDLVQGNFLESYRNLTYKHVMGLKWTAEHCNGVNYIIKTDDDILVDMYRLINLIENTKFQMMGYILKDMRPIRMKANKWYVTTDEYPDDAYPPFMSGWMYTLKMSAARRLLQHVRDFKYFWIDDIFVTGMLAQKANVTLTDISNLFSLHPEVVECCLRKALSCDFIAAPDGGDHNLQIKFQAHAKYCYVSTCPTLPPGTKIEDKCVAKRKLPQLKKGLPKITVIH